MKPLLPPPRGAPKIPVFYLSSFSPQINCTWASSMDPFCPTGLSRSCASLLQEPLSPLGPNRVEPLPKGTRCTLLLQVTSLSLLRSEDTSLLPMGMHAHTYTCECKVTHTEIPVHTLTPIHTHTHTPDPTVSQPPRANRRASAWSPCVVAWGRHSQEDVHGSSLEV